MLSPDTLAGRSSDTVRKKSLLPRPAAARHRCHRRGEQHLPAPAPLWQATATFQPFDHRRTHIYTPHPASPCKKITVKSPPPEARRRSRLPARRGRLRGAGPRRRFRQGPGDQGGPRGLAVEKTVVGFYDPLGLADADFWGRGNKGAPSAGGCAPKSSVGRVALAG